MLEKCEDGCCLVTPMILMTLWNKYSDKTSPPSSY